MRKLLAPLNKASTYVFELATRVNDTYAVRIGTPKGGSTNITLKTESFIFDAQIKCVRKKFDSIHFLKSDNIIHQKMNDA